MTKTLILTMIALLLILSPAHRIEEDDPAWDCATMGNHICGEVTK